MQKKHGNREKGTGTIEKKRNHFYLKLRIGDKVKLTPLLGPDDKPVTTRPDAEKAAALLRPVLRATQKEEIALHVANARKLKKKIILPVEKVWQTFLKQSSRPDSGEATLNGYYKLWNLFTKWLHQEHPEITKTSQITHEIAAEYFNWIWQDHISPRSYNSRKHALSLIFKHILEVAGMEENPFKEIPLKPMVTEAREAFTEEQVQQIFNGFDTGFYYDTVLDIFGKGRKHEKVAKRLEFKVYRQGKDRLFMEILRNIRHGEYNVRNIEFPGLGRPVSSIVALNLMCLGKHKGESNQATSICSTRREAKRINAQRLALLNTQPYIFRAKITGDFKSREKLTDDLLELKVGARVMTLVNRRESDNQFLYVNGDTGVVAEIDCDEEGHGFVTVDLDNGKRVEVGYYRWVASEYSAVEDVITDNTVMKRRVVGSFEQIPLKLAYAITIHKSQGMGFDQVNIFLGNGCFEKGQLYTALSRSRTLEGLSLDHCIREEDVMSDPAVVEFYKKLEEEKPVDSKLYAEIMLTMVFSKLKR